MKKFNRETYAAAASDARQTTRAAIGLLVACCQFNRDFAAAGIEACDAAPQALAMYRYYVMQHLIEARGGVAFANPVSMTLH